MKINWVSSTNTPVMLAREFVCVGMPFAFGVFPKAPKPEPPPKATDKSIAVAAPDSSVKLARAKFALPLLVADVQFVGEESPMGPKSTPTNSATWAGTVSRIARAGITAKSLLVLSLTTISISFEPSGCTVKAKVSRLALLPTWSLTNWLPFQF